MVEEEVEKEERGEERLPRFRRSRRSPHRIQTRSGNID